MPLGPGVYDPECTALKKQFKADGVIVIVVRGTRGSGFSANVTADVLKRMPAFLEEVAKRMRNDVFG